MLLKQMLMAVAVGSCISACAFAQGEEPDPLVTDRPDFTESAETVPEGRFQVEGGYTFNRSRDEREHTAGELLLRVGLSPRTELRIGVPSYVWTRNSGAHNSGLEDASLGAKIKLVDGDPGFGLRRPDIAVVVETSVPTGAAAYRENALQPEVKLCLAWALSERLDLGTNLNWGYPREEGLGYSQLSGSIAAGYALTEVIGTYLEVYGFAPESRLGQGTSYLNGGLTYLVNNDFQLDGRLGTRLNGRTSDYFLGIGASRRW